MNLKKNALWEVAQFNIPANGKLLYLLMLDNIRHDNSIKIRRREFADILGISPATVSNNMRRMRKKGLIAITPTYNEDGGRSANKYTLL